MKTNIAVLFAGGAMLLSAQTIPTWDQAWLEHIFSGGELICGSDDPYVPHRDRNALSELSQFMTIGGWTTNHLVESLMFVMTNNMTKANWADETKRRMARRAASSLSEINLPTVTNFFRAFNDADDTPRLKMQTIPGMIWYTHLEPEVLDYMRTLCVRTNIYMNVETMVMNGMFETLETMPSEMKSAATNRVARYMYFAIGHTTRGTGWQDRELAKFIPAYSNSIQRLQLMQHVANTVTNVYARANANKVVQALSAFPTNHLNDISWISE